MSIPQGISEGLFTIVAAVIATFFISTVLINICDIVDYAQGRRRLDELSGLAQAFVTRFLDRP